MYYPSTQHDDYYEDEGWGLGAYAGDADDPAGQHAGTHLGQRVTDRNGAHHFILWDKDYKIPVAVPFNQQAYDAYMRKHGNTEKIYKGCINLPNGDWAWVDKKDTGRILKWEDPDLPHYAEKLIITRVNGFFDENGRNTRSWAVREAERRADMMKKRALQAQRPTRPDKVARPPRVGGGEDGAAAGPAPPRGGAPAGRGRGPSPAVQVLPAPRPLPTAAPATARAGFSYAAAAAIPAAPAAAAPAAAAPAAAGAAAGKPRGAAPVYDGRKSIKGVPLLHLPNSGTQWNDDDRENFRKWVVDFITNFNRTGQITKDIPTTLIPKFTKKDSDQIEIQKNAYKKYWDWKRPGHVYPDAPKNKSAAPPPAPGQAAARPPAQAQRPTHKAVQHARDLQMIFENLSRTGSSMDQTSLDQIKSKKFYESFVNFVKVHVNGMPVPEGGVFGVVYKMVYQVEEHRDWIKDAQFTPENYIACNLMLCLRYGNIQLLPGLFNPAQMEEVKLFYHCGKILESLANEMQKIMDDNAKMKAHAQQDKVLLDAARRVLDVKGGDSAPPEDLRSAVEAVREKIKKNMYDTEAKNDNDIKIQIAAAMMAFEIQPKEPGAALFAMLQRMISMLPLQHFKKLVTPSGLFLESCKMCKDWSKPPEEDGAAAGGGAERLRLWPAPPPVPVAPVPGSGGVDGPDAFHTVTADDIARIRELHEKRRQATRGAPWNSTGGGRVGQNPRIPDVSGTEGSNFKSAVGPRGRGRVVQAYQGSEDDDPVEQLIKKTESGETPDVTGRVTEVIEEASQEEQEAAAEDPGRSRSSSSSAARAGPRARSASRGPGEGGGGEDAEVRPVRSMPTGRKPGAPTPIEIMSMTWKKEHPDATPDEFRSAMEKMIRRDLDAHYTPEDIKGICDKVEQSFRFERLSQKYDEY